MVGEDFGAEEEEEEEEERESGGFRNTHKQTGWASNLFRKWLSENGFEPGFESLPAAELNRALREFYRGVRNHDGNTYSASSYKSLRAGLNRHLQSPSGQLPRRLCLIRDQEFSGANRAFTDVLKTLRAEGKDSPHYHTPISPQDLRKIRLSGILGFQNPQSLVNKVWFDLQLHFAKRGSEMHRDLPHDAFRILRAPSGRRYAAFRYPAKGKRGYGDPERAGKMYDVPGDPYCPVFSLELYLSKLPPDPPAFYLRPVKLTPSQMQQQPVWYKREPMGVNYLGTMMPRLSSEARLSRRYTNHSLRSTAIRLLYDAGLGPREIMEVTGHRSAIRHLREVSEARYGTRESGENSGEKGGKAYGRIEEEPGRRVESIDRNNNINMKDQSGVNEADRAVLCCPPPSGQREQSWSDGDRDLEEGEEGFSLIDRVGTNRSEVRLHPPSELSQHSGPQKLSFLATGREGFERQAPIFLNINPDAPPLLNPHAPPGPSSSQTSSPLKRVTLLLCRPPQNSPGLESRLRGPSAPYRKILARGSGMEIRNEPSRLEAGDAGLRSANEHH